MSVTVIPIRNAPAPSNPMACSRAPMRGDRVTILRRVPGTALKIEGTAILKERLYGGDIPGAQLWLVSFVDDSPVKTFERLIAVDEEGNYV